MLTRIFLGGALLAGYLSFVLLEGKAQKHGPYVQGKNKTVLFITNSEHGLSNVHLATSFALLENYPDIDVHFASFSEIQPKLKRISSLARNKSSSARDLIFHEINGPTFAQAIIKEDTDFISPPGSAGIDSLAKHIQLWISPWSVEEHMEIFNQLRMIIDEVDAAVVVLDTWFRPAIDITRYMNRQHAFITPNTLIDNFIGDQPLASMIWKYPAAASGFHFPVPLHNIPENIYLNTRYIYSAMFTPRLSAKKKILAQNGLKEPTSLFAIKRSDTPWITQSTEDAMIPVDFIPPNVTCAGPIVLSGASASEQDPELAAWLDKAPTVLINLGSTVAYDESRAAAMSTAIAEVLDKLDVQILWKFNQIGLFLGNVLSPLEKYLENDRLRMPKWLLADPSSLLETGNIIASVHHGGSNCYHEAIAVGLPQVIFPLWADLYNFAGLAETIGVGVWGCRAISPEWTSECLRDSLLRVLDASKESISIKSKAKEIGNKIQSGERGRNIAAREVARLAYTR